MNEERFIIEFDDNNHDYTPDELELITDTTVVVTKEILDTIPARCIPAVIQSIFLTLIANSTCGAKEETVLAEIDRLVSVVKRDYPKAAQAMREYLSN